VGANTRLDSLSDLARHRANLRVQCRTCERVAVIDAARFNRYCLLRRWNNQLAQLGVRLTCGGCGARNVHLKATPEAAGADRFPRDERAWKQLYRLLRD
jgi:hypothetical protein